MHKFLRHLQEQARVCQAVILLLCLYSSGKKKIKKGTLQLKQDGVHDFNLNTWEMCVFHLWQAVLAFLSIKMSLTGAVSPRYFVLPEWDQSQITSALIFNRYGDARGC